MYKSLILTYMHTYTNVMCHQKSPHTRTHNFTHTISHTQIHTHTHVGGEREGAKKSSVCEWLKVWLCVVTCRGFRKRKKRETESLRRAFRETEYLCVSVCVCV